MEYLKLKLTSFKIVIHVSIWLDRGKVKSKNMGFSIFMIGHC